MRDPARDRRAFVVWPLFMLGLYGVALSPLFRVERVVVTGLPAAEVDNLRATLRLAPGANLLAVESPALIRSLEESPRVVTARVVRRIPSTLEVRVTPRLPVAAVPYGDGLFEVDEEGRVLGPASEPGSLPVLTGVLEPGRALEIGAIASPGLASAARLAVSLRPILENRLVELNVSAGGERTLYLSDKSLVRWGASEGRPEDPVVRRRTEVLAALLQEWPDGQALDVDLRDPDRVVVRRR